MSIRNNASITSWLEMLSAGTNLPSLTAAQTVMCWVYTVTLPIRSTIFGVKGNDALIRQGLGNYMNENVNDFFLIANGGGDSGKQTGVGITLNVWYHVAISQASGTSRTVWFHDAAGALISAWTLSSTTSLTGTMESVVLLGDATGATYYHSGRIGAMKVWTSALTQPQVQAELGFANPQLLTNFWGGWPLQTLASRNTFIGGGSGTPGTWTINGAGLSDEADPPIVFDQVNWDQAGFRWRENDGTEVTASYLAPQNTNITRAANVPTRLRMLVDSNDLDPDPEALRWEYRKKGSGQAWRVL